jgi:DNA-binding transcriptional LysR family regulator
MVDDRIDLAIRVGPVDLPDAVVRRVAVTPLACAGSRRYFERHGIPTTPSDLTHHNCLIYGDAPEGTKWSFAGPDGPYSVPVRGNLSSNSVETIRAGVLADLGIGLFTRTSLAEELCCADVVTVLDDYLNEVRDISLVWPKRRFVPLRVRRATEFFAGALPKRFTA